MNFEEYRELQKNIKYHMDRYYNQDAPEISDFEYDQLMQQLKAAEKEHPEWADPDSPSQKVGGTVKREAGVKVTPVFSDRLNIKITRPEDLVIAEAIAAARDEGEKE